MKVEVNAQLCVGCGLCVDTCPEVFIMNEDKAKTKTNPVPGPSVECCIKAKEDCPAEAISIEG